MKRSGHAVRAVYSYSGMADIAMETGDIGYHSAVRSLWDNIVNKKYYVTGGVGSGETSEGFGKNYSLPNHAYCESCAGCGELFFQYKMNLIHQDGPVRRPVRGDDLQRDPRRRGPGGEEFHVHQRAGFLRSPLPLARLPLLRGQHPQDPAPVADVDVRRRAPTAFTSTSSSAARVAVGAGRRNRRANGPGDGLSVERQGVDHRESGRRDRASPSGSACPIGASAELYTSTPDSDGIDVPVGQRLRPSLPRSRRAMP